MALTNAERRQHKRSSIPRDGDSPAVHRERESELDYGTGRNSPRPACPWSRPRITTKMSSLGASNPAVRIWSDTASVFWNHYSLDEHRDAAEARDWLTRECWTRFAFAAGTVCITESISRSSLA
ncbi:unnamed protein product [Mycena citricolor]|uniref:Uncharacterized protein n=1 Tax=Mycena citricolor TaxID=2018698 RepID=A0AAD2H159_9AGAR|nr:unnamed protein product [Mycena citricolor]